MAKATVEDVKQKQEELAESVKELEAKKAKEVAQDELTACRKELAALEAISPKTVFSERERKELEKLFLTHSERVVDREITRICRKLVSQPMDLLEGEFSRNFPILSDVQTLDNVIRAATLSALARRFVDKMAELAAEAKLGSTAGQRKELRDRIGNLEAKVK